ncbi:MAG TPA: Stk1 family PASTA domain-containing Ser/Thr kinase [Chloroflexaceae bacterium]|nr:Stk1 family PASTA domain-containing Ser/Thr kinase [Chloroflexaceae bacterium]
MQKKVLDGRYELERKVGEGGMARIYAGRDLRLNRRVAIKIPHSHFLGEPDFLERFRHEAQAAAMLSHPNIVDVYDVGQDEDVHYIVMEFVEGTDLKAIIKREAPLPVERAVALAQQIARGLHAAHRAGMVHRDIKPQNVIVTADGRPHITDFGVAKSHLSTALTETGVSFGTVDYISPEQAQGRPATPQSDLYALGVVLFEMLTGRLPFTGDGAVAVAMKHVAEPPPALRRLNPAVPPGLEALVLRALAKDPAARPRSAHEFAELLAAYDQLAQQDTVVNQAVLRPPPPPPAPAPQPRPAPNTSATGRVSMPPPRTAPTRAPRQDGLGCGVFLVGLLVLAGVLGLIFLLSTGAVGQLFAGLGGATGGGAATAAPGQPAATLEPGEPTPTPTVEVPVPNLSGLTADAADTALRQVQLIPVRQEANDSLVAIGQVIRQEVAPGTLLAPSQPVTYTVSLGPQLIEVPDVARVPAELARQQLAARGFPVELAEEASQSVDAGFVIRQAPSAGLLVPQGQVVTIVVSRGDVVRFPDVIGLQRDEAERILAGAPGLVLVFVDEQGRDRLIDYDRFRDDEVVSALDVERDQPVVNGQFIPRGSRIVLGVKAPE